MKTLALAAALFAVALQANAAQLSDIKTWVILMKENRSTDQMLSDLAREGSYGSEFDAMDPTAPIPTGRRFPATLVPFRPPVGYRADPAHSWAAMWYYYAQGVNNGWKQRNMAYYTRENLPFYHALAEQFATSDRYFCSALAPTFPNRSFFWAGTSYGITSNGFSPRVLARRGVTPVLIFDRLDEVGVTWGYYSEARTSFLKRMFGKKYPVKAFTEFYAGLEAGTLPEVVYLEASHYEDDEHPGADPSLGDAWTRDIVSALMNSSLWSNMAVLITYDENGGHYDHVVPPAAVPPDDYLAFNAGTKNNYRQFDVYGHRVPFYLASPFAKRHYVSHEVADHTSVLALLRARYGFAPLAQRDAVAHNLLDMFDF